MVKDGFPTIVINKGVDERAGTAELNVNKYPLSSSLLPVSSLSAQENPGYDHCHTWAQNAELDHKDHRRVHVAGRRGGAGAGAAAGRDQHRRPGRQELRILKGARKCLESALCVVSEVEFFEESTPGRGCSTTRWATWAAWVTGC